MSVSRDQGLRLINRVLGFSARKAEDEPEEEVAPSGDSMSMKFRGEFEDEETGQIISWLVYAVVASNEAMVVSVDKKLRPVDKPKQEDTMIPALYARVSRERRVWLQGYTYWPCSRRLRHAWAKKRQPSTLSPPLSRWRTWPRCARA